MSWGKYLNSGEGQEQLVCTLTKLPLQKCDGVKESLALNTRSWVSIKLLVQRTVTLIHKKGQIRTDISLRVYFHSSNVT